MGTTDSPADATETPVDPDAIRERLDRVNDPELDRSIVELQYIDDIDIDGGSVTVTFVLPTAWCSPAFAWMMATGIRDEVRALPGVTDVTVRLPDHMHGEQITTGVNREQSFESIFEDAEDGIADVRRKLDEKARFARQYDAIRALRDSGLDPDQIVSLTRDDIDLEFRSAAVAVSVRDGVLTVTAPREPLSEYLEKARATGLVTDGTDRLFADRDGSPLDPEPEAFEFSLRDARLAVSNIEGQATICASLHESRNDVTIDEPGD
ncbi:iron-sulfur cluster assembly protein [Halapricum hydrolyticum]|uniref:Iron-sulfur cluster assembly protein n=1 Tax=Halapricum hydrolyticum TaxID=2979991 RepID=A0AAE3IDS6_9EURY|nr:iron-sulfur cluster assembly protein [Halapricum hydrolyticum]MCU4718104.1 iron-sulfur cluster assembly protein [Halapricum hydrolyticum]MCU4727388.1 iron-sulfur cluster assembly protein [Halapricum hydrolyticum]